MKRGPLKKAILAFQTERFDEAEKADDSRVRFYVQNPECLDAIINDLLLLDKSEFELDEDNYNGVFCAAAKRLIAARVVWKLKNDSDRKRGKLA